MHIDRLSRHRSAISTRLRRLRLERRWSQAALARELGASQRWISDIELGKGSLTAEQFLAVLRLFNATVDDFAPPRKDPGPQLQNALARLGATHLAESADLLPTDRLREAQAVLLETLVGAESPRHIAALGPLIVSQLEYLPFGRLRARFAELGYERRFLWLLESVRAALARSESEVLPREFRVRYRKAQTALAAVFSFHDEGVGAQPDAPEDILDREVATEKGVAEVREESSGIARRWRVITRIETDDFVQALRQARESR